MAWRGSHRCSLIIDDSYNANPTSVKAAIDILAGLKGRRILVLGDMGELGEWEQDSHREVGTYAREQGLDALYAVGRLSALAVESFGANGLLFGSRADLVDALRPELDATTRVLVKGSRSAGMEEVVAGLQITTIRPTDMLLLLTQYLQQFYTGFSVFQYLTLRGILGVLTALGLALFLGPWMIRTLSFRQIGQSVRNDGPQSHLSKAGTPTMGGALILVAIGVSTLLWADLSNLYVWVVLGVTFAFGAVGWVDDYRKVVEKNSRGLPSRWKYFWRCCTWLPIRQWKPH